MCCGHLVVSTTACDLADGDTMPPACGQGFTARVSGFRVTLLRFARLGLHDPNLESFGLSSSQPSTPNPEPCARELADGDAGREGEPPACHDETVSELMACDLGSRFQESLGFVA